MKKLGLKQHLRQLSTAHSRKHIPMPPDALCTCTGPPWPAMTRLHAAEPNHYYLCPNCRRIREDITAPDGAITARRLYEENERGKLPESVRELAAQIESQPRYEQQRLL